MATRVLLLVGKKRKKRRNSVPMRTKQNICQGTAVLILKQVYYPSRWYLWEKLLHFIWKEEIQFSSKVGLKTSI